MKDMLGICYSIMELLAVLRCFLKIIRQFNTSELLLSASKETPLGSFNRTGSMTASTCCSLFFFYSVVLSFFSHSNTFSTPARVIFDWTIFTPSGIRDCLTRINFFIFSSLSLIIFLYGIMDRFSGC